MAEPAATSGPDDDLLAPPDAACCAGACGPIFERPLLEQLFIRIRDAVAGRPRQAASPTEPPTPGAEGWTTDD